MGDSLYVVVTPAKTKFQNKKVGLFKMLPGSLKKPNSYFWQFKIGVGASALLNAYSHKDQKSKLHYTRGITPKRVTSGGVHLRGLAPAQHSSKKNRSGGELLVTLCPI